MREARKAVVEPQSVAVAMMNQLLLAVSSGAGGKEQRVRGVPIHAVDEAGGGDERRVADARREADEECREPEEEPAAALLAPPLGVGLHPVEDLLVKGQEEDEQRVGYHAGDYQEDLLDQGEAVP